MIILIILSIIVSIVSAILISAKAKDKLALKGNKFAEPIAGTIFLISLFVILSLLVCLILFIFPLKG
ncbi:MAG: hypothetical protein V4687_02520 [Bacteroidota bacterium]